MPEADAEQDIRDRLRNYRRKNRLTQAQIARKLGVDETQVSNWETKRHDVSDKHRENIQELIGKPHPRRHYRCTACLNDPRTKADETASWDLENDEEYGGVLDHYAREHPDSDILQQLVGETQMRTICEGCLSEFVSDLHVSGEFLAVDNYCGDCIEDDPIRSLIVDTKPGHLVVERYVCTGIDR